MGNSCFKKSFIFHYKNQGTFDKLAPEENMWNNLPPEVWMQIFEQFSSLKDIQNCYFTCQKWQSIIKTMFKDKAKIIVGFGVPPAGLNMNVVCGAVREFVPANHSGGKCHQAYEIFDLIDQTLKIEFDNGDEYDYESGYDHAIGGLMKNKYLYILDSEVLVYPNTDSDESENEEDDGDDLIDCHFLGKQMNSMVLERRRNASSIIFNETTIWVTGGHASEDEDSLFEDLEDRFSTAKSTTEFIKYGEPSIEGPELPFKIFGHTMVKVNSETVYIIGGFSDEECDQTWVVDLSANFDIKPGPCLNEGRCEHSSSTMKINEKLYIVVAGGRFANDYGYQLNSVELLDTEFPQNGWIMGPKLPLDNLYGSTMVTSPTGKGVVVIGGITNSPTMTKKRFVGNANYSLSATATMLELSGDSIDRLQWKTLDQKLRYERAYSLAFSIPDDVVDDLETTRINSGTPGVTDCHILTRIQS